MEQVKTDLPQNCVYPDETGFGNTTTMKIKCVFFLAKNCSLPVEIITLINQGCDLPKNCIFFASVSSIIEIKVERSYLNLWYREEKTML